MVKPSNAAGKRASGICSLVTSGRPDSTKPSVAMAEKAAAAAAPVYRNRLLVSKSKGPVVKG